MNRFIIFVSTAAYTGYAPLAPGTVGTLIGVLLCFAFSRSAAIAGPSCLLTLVALFFLAAWAAGRAEAIFGESDSQRITIDEVVGYLVAMLFVPFSWTNAAIVFAVFRIFDIVKPYPIRLVERRLPGGYAVVVDDVLAGIYANLVFRLGRSLLQLIA